MASSVVQRMMTDTETMNNPPAKNWALYADGEAGSDDFALT